MACNKETGERETKCGEQQPLEPPPLEPYQRPPCVVNLPPCAHIEAKEQAAKAKEKETKTGGPCPPISAPCKRDTIV